jgi:ABC-2 type transport system ATP-binding protein
LIKVNNLTKKFKIAIPGKSILEKGKQFFLPKYSVIEAVKEIDFDIREGEIVGLLGPNGAGKSTTIKLLTGVLVPTEGAVTVNGLNPSKKRIQNAFQIGVVYGQRSQLWWDLPLIDSFEILGAMYKLRGSKYKNNLDFIVDLFQLEDFLEQPVRKLSLGQKMRADIGAALLHEPSIIYLDEPALGLDIIAKNRIFDFIKKLNEESNTTIILTTHNLYDVEKICQRIMIIDKGRLILDSPQKLILEKYGKNRSLIVTFFDGIQEVNISGAEVVIRNSNELEINFNRDQISAFELIASLGQNKGIRDVSIQEANIETIVAQIYETGI